MKKSIQILVALSVVATVLMVSSPVMAGPPSNFTGHWQAIDDDRSDIRLTIAGPAEGPFRITWTESYFSYCGGEAGIARGTGTLSGNELTAELTLECFTTGNEIDFTVTWVYDAGTDTISSGFITWHRPSSRSQACIPQPNGLTAWWPGDGDASELISGRYGEFQDDATTGSGLVDFAFRLDGHFDFINIPDSAGLNFGPGDFTIDLWVNFTDIAGEQVLIEKWVQGDPNVDGWTLTKLDNQVLRLALESGDGGEIDVDSEPLNIQPGIWYHFAATRQGSTVTLYMNGNELAQSDSVTSNLDTPASLKFGHRGNPDDTPGSSDERGFYLNGRIDEVELFIGTALTVDQIHSLYAAGSAGKCKDAIPPRLDLRVNYGHDWVESFYEPGHQVTITVTEGDGMTVKGIAVVWTEPKWYWGDETGFQTSDSIWMDPDWNPMEFPPDIQPYDWVYGRVDNGAAAQVRIGEITGVIDKNEDSIQGTIFTPWFFDKQVWVECHLWISPEPDMEYDLVTPDGADEYYCSWVGEYDLETGWDIGPSYYGPDGHWVANVVVVP